MGFEMDISGAQNLHLLKFAFTVHSLASGPQNMCPFQYLKKCTIRKHRIIKQVMRPKGRNLAFILLLVERFCLNLGTNLNIGGG